MCRSIFFASSFLFVIIPHFSESYMPSPLESIHLGVRIAEEQGGHGDTEINVPFDLGVNLPDPQDCGVMREVLGELLQDPENSLVEEEGSGLEVEVEREESGERVTGVVVLVRGETTETRSYTEDYRVCRGHWRYQSDTASSDNRARNKCHDWAERERRSFEPNVDSDTVWVNRTLEKKRWGTRHYRYAFFCKHTVNAPNCDCHDGGIRTYDYQVPIKTPWVPTDPDFYAKVQASQATVVEVQKPSDDEHRILFVREAPSVVVTPLPKRSRCQLVSERCLSQDPLGCLRWKRRYRCFSLETIKEGLCVPDIEMAQEESQDPQALSRAMALFSVMEQMNSPGAEAIFSGSSVECSESRTGVLDCCKNSGLVKDLYLSHCSDKELALLEDRQAGLCVFIGEYSVSDTLGFKRRKRSFCRFASQLSRVFQEQARGQLALGWGTPEHPDCRGLTIEEMQRLDFDRIDLSEAFAEVKVDPDLVESRVTGFLQRLEESVGSVSSQSKIIQEV